MQAAVVTGTIQNDDLPTPTPSSTATATATVTPTATPSSTSTLTPTLTPTGTLTPSPTLTVTSTPTATATLMVTPTLTPTATSTATSTAAASLTPTPTATATLGPVTIPEDNQDKKPKLTDEQRQDRQHTNQSNRDDVYTEGNVVEVRQDEQPPYVVIANRDGLVRVNLLCGSHCPTIHVGDYLQADGSKESEVLFDADEVSISR